MTEIRTATGSIYHIDTHAGTWARIAKTSEGGLVPEKGFFREYAGLCVGSRLVLITGPDRADGFTPALVTSEICFLEEL